MSRSSCDASIRDSVAEEFGAEIKLTEALSQKKTAHATHTTHALTHTHTHTLILLFL